MHAAKNCPIVTAFHVRREISEPEGSPHLRAAEPAGNMTIMKNEQFLIRFWRQEHSQREQSKCINNFMKQLFRVSE
jgi:hypothetical protein